MDINDYLDQIKKSIEERTQGIINDIHVPPSSLSRRNPVQENKPEPSVAQEEGALDSLYVHDLLEDSSKSRIGTFERLYRDTFVEETRRPIARGYNDLDYSPLVGTLCGMLETELYRSIIPMAKVRYPSSTTVQFAIMHRSLGAVKHVVSRHKELLNGYIPSPQQFEDNLYAIKEYYRNPSSHGKTLEMNSFLSFYALFQPFFNKNIDGLMRMKNELSQLSPKVLRAKAEPNQDEADYLQTLIEPTSGTPACRHKGVMFTDCEKLSQKYFGGTNDKVSIQGGSSISYTDFVRQMLMKYIHEYSALGIEYLLADVSSPELHKAIRQNNSWKDYYNALGVFCDAHPELLNEEDPPALFIIGGHDVIPMPRLANPAHSLSEFEARKREADKDVDADFLYAYGNEFIQEDPVDIRLDIFVQTNPYFTVGRLPLEEGYMTTSFNDDICHYLERSLEAHRAGGIQLHNEPVMTVSESWKTVSCDTIKGLPLKQLEIIPGFTDNSIISSPCYRLDEKGEQGPVQYCIDRLMETEMLLFDLHGSHQPQRPAYTGQGADTKTRSDYPVAFIPSFFEQASAKIVACVCCFGARFINYRREDSSLLESIYRNVLLFMGSSRTAYGNVDPIRKEDRIPEKCKSASSSLLLRYYVALLLSGVEAGKALAIAKQVFVQKNSQEEWHNILLITMLEFNLFGDPLLRVMPLFRCDTTQAFQKLSPADATPFAETYKSRIIYGKNTSSQDSSFLGHVQELVNRNLTDVHNTIAEKLYKEYNLQPRTLQLVQKYDSSKGNSGYLFTFYDEENIRDGDANEIIIRTTEKGEILNFVQAH